MPVEFLVGTHQIPLPPSQKNSSYPSLIPLQLSKAYKCQSSVSICSIVDVECIGAESIGSESIGSVSIGSSTGVLSLAARYLAALKIAFSATGTKVFIV